MTPVEAICEFTADPSLELFEQLWEQLDETNHHAFAQCLAGYVHGQIKKRDKMQRAHDLIAATILGEARNHIKVDKQSAQGLRAACDVLCWVLDHAHNPTFAQNLELIEKTMEAAGFVLTPAPPSRSFPA